MKKPARHLIAEVPRRQAKVEITIGIDLGDIWSHYCTLNQDGEVVYRGRFRTIPKAIEKWFTDVPPARVAMEAGTHSIWISAQLQGANPHLIRDLRIFGGTKWERTSILIRASAAIRPTSSAAVPSESISSEPQRYRRWPPSGQWPWAKLPRAQAHRLREPSSMNALEGLVSPEKTTERSGESSR
jgi:hypothetical protein